MNMAQVLTLIGNKIKSLDILQYLDRKIEK